MSYGASSRLLGEQPAEMRREPNSASHTATIRTDRNQRGIDLKSAAKTVRMSAMVDALTAHRTRMRMMRLVNSNFGNIIVSTLRTRAIHLLSNREMKCKSTFEVFARSNGLARFSDLPNRLISANRARSQYAR